MKRLLLAVLALSLSACGRQLGDEFRAGFPSAEQVKLKFPQKAGQALTGTAQRQDGLEGETADLYKLTREVSVGVNGGTTAVLSLVRTIADYPPTQVTANQAVWGPWTDALSPNTYKFTVTKQGDGSYQYVLVGKGKNELDAAFRTLLSGTHHPTLDAQGNEVKDFGHGAFLIDFDQAQHLPEHDDTVGTVAITYSHDTQADDAKIDAVFTQVKDKKTGKLADSVYAYVATPNSGGTFDLTVSANMDSQPQVEQLTVRSRWLQSGSGRSDAKATGGDFGTAQYTANECWDENFLSRFLNLSYDAAKNYGQQSVCAFPSAEYSTLALNP